MSEPMPQPLWLPAIPEVLPVLKKDGASLRLRPSPMRPDVVDGLIPSGTNLLFGLRKACREAGIRFTTLCWGTVFIDGTPVPYEAWATTLVREGQYVSVCIPLGKGGGKNPLTAILSLVVVAVSIWAGPAAAGLMGFVEETLAFGVASAFVSGAVMMGGMLLVNQIAGASQPKLAEADNETAARVWSIDGARNRADPYGPVPLVLGKIRFAPRFAASYYSVLSGNDQYVRYLYVASMGNVQVSDPRIGDTPLGNFQGCDWRVYQNWQGGGFAWFNWAVSEEALSVAVKNSIGWTTRTTKPDTTHIALFLTFNGLKRIDSEGNASPAMVRLQVRYRKVGTSGWIYHGGQRWTGGGSIGGRFDRRNLWDGSYIGILQDGSLAVNNGEVCVTYSVSSESWYEENRDSYGGTYYYNYSIVITGYANGFTGSAWVENNRSSMPIVHVGAGSISIGALEFSGQTVTAQRRGVEFDVTPGQYEVSVWRETPDSDKETTKQTTMDECTWTTLQSWRDRPAVVYQGRPLTIIEVQLKATEQLSGSVDEFNVRCESVAPCWTGSAWSWQATNNPASLALAVATSECTGKAAKFEEIDLTAYADFYNWCQRWGWAYNAVQTSRTTAGELQHNIMGAGRGSYALLNGHGVVWDDPQSPVVDILTPRNTWGFSARKEFLSEPVHGLRMRFLNELKDFQEDERIVYADGYSASNATNVIEWEQDGVTHPDLIWKHGRLRLAEIRLRPETYTLNAEAESLTLRRGEHVRCQHDVTLWGMASGRVIAREVDGDGKVVAVELDEDCPMEAGKAYGLRVSAPAAPDVYYSVRTIHGVARRLEFPMPLPVTSQTPDTGDLAVFGIAGRTDQRLVVMGITPAEGLTAQITLQDASTNIYDALTGDIPAWDSNVTAPSRYQKGKPPTPEIISIVSDETVLLPVAAGKTQPRMRVTFGVPETPVVIESVTLHLREAGTTDPWKTISELWQGQASLYASEVTEKTTYEIRMTTRSNIGVDSDLSGLVLHTVIGRTTPPPPPDAVFINGTVITWTLADEPLDVIGWEIVMGMDAEDSITMGLVVSNGLVRDKTFDIAPWAGWARRVFVVTVDELGLKSTPVSVAINLGDMPVGNVVFTVSEKDREWPGQVDAGKVLAGCLVANDGAPFWSDEPFWS